MISGEKILITGASGLVGLEIARYLADQNEVWGLARYASEGERSQAMNSYVGGRTRETLEETGLKTVPCDLEKGDFSAVPDDFTYVIHLAHTRRGLTEFWEAIQVNAIGAGKLLQHCQKAKAALVVSSTAVYSPPADDVFHRFTEEDDIGRAYAPWAPTSPVSKVSLEAVSRFCAEAFDLPISLMRLNTVYGNMGGMPVNDVESIAGGKTVTTFADPYPHTPIHIDDMCDQLEALLNAASVPANIINWCGDEVITQRQWCDFAAEFSGQKVELVVNEIPGTPNGNVSDNTKRKSITGPCKRVFKEALHEIYLKRSQ